MQYGEPFDNAFEWLGFVFDVDIMTYNYRLNSSTLEDETHSLPYVPLEPLRIVISLHNTPLSMMKSSLRAMDQEIVVRVKLGVSSTTEPSRLIVCIAWNIRYW